MTLAVPDFFGKDSDPAVLDSVLNERLLLRKAPSVIKEQLRGENPPVLSSQDARIPPREFDALLRLPALEQPRWKVTVLQQWIGTVEAIEGKLFSATLQDATDPRNPIEEVELEQAELSPSDLPLLDIGATFYWSIGYLDSAGGQRQRVSTFRFARRPRLSSADLKYSYQLADRLAAFLDRD
jgi:hypothetical protein